jgi:glycosyltransferase involved in cell wall biosynthesis
MKNCHCQGAKSPATSAMIAVLGKCDAPTDGVRDYCASLDTALRRHGVSCEILEVSWDRRGWTLALWDVWNRSAAWNGQWVLLQYTAMTWSRRGFPFGALVVLAILRCRGVRVAVVFHEPFGLGGARWVDCLREACQNWVVRRLYKKATKSIMTEPLHTLRWLPAGDKKAVFIPIGANIPERIHAMEAAVSSNQRAQTIAVFCLSAPPNRHAELKDISYVVRSLAKDGVSSLHVVFIGRGTTDAKSEIEQSFEGISAGVSILGLQPAEVVSKVLAESDVQLSVRGRLYLRRGSAIAGIACGLPIVGYAGAAEGTPLVEAGVELVPYRDTAALLCALRRILSDPFHASTLRERSIRAQQKYFSWDRIARRLIEALNSADTD